MLCALIMAGGKGERFWPLSTEEKPKQFLNLLGEETMIQMTVNRLKDIIPLERIFVVTGKRYVNLVKEQVPLLPERNIIVEPVGRNTAPCIGLSAFVIEKYYKDATIVVLPSDHLIRDEKKFQNSILAGYEFIKLENEAIVTLGMKPDRPETGYGYINYAYIKENINGFEIRKVNKFVEKPDLDTAKKYISCGDFLWNGGMFIWKSSNIFNLTNKYLHDTYMILNEIAVASESEFEDILEEKYELLESVSIDYGIMEKAPSIYVIPSDFGWDDVGNWSSIERYKEKDVNGNVVNQNAVTYNSENNIILTNKKIVLNDIRNLIIVETDDCIMISSKEQEQNIKLAKNELNSGV